MAADCVEDGWLVRLSEAGYYPRAAALPRATMGIYTRAQGSVYAWAGGREQRYGLSVFRH